MKSCSQHSLFLIIFAQPSSGIKVIQRQAAASVTDPLLCDSLVKKKKTDTKKKKYWMQTAWSVKRGHCFWELREVCHQSAHGFLSVFFGFRCEALALQRVAAGTAKITLVPESKDLHFPPGPFCETSAPVHPGQPRLLLCACTCVEVYVCVFALSLYCRETVEG